MADTKDKFKKVDEKQFFSFSGENGRSIKATSYWLEYTIEKTGELKTSHLVEIRTTKNQYDEQSRKTFVQQRIVTIDQEQFEGLLANYLEKVKE